MSFLSPLYLVGAAAACLPIVLHLLERRTERRVRFSAVALLRNAPVQHAARRRLRELLLLALRVAALVLLAVAFARPFLRGAAAEGSGLTVVALDTSLSMSAPSTSARARQLARDAVRTAPGGDEVALVTFAGAADVAVRPTADRGLVNSAIDAAAFGFGSTSYRAGLSAAGQLFSGRGGKIVVVTDLQASGWDAGGRASLPAAVRVDVKDVGAPPENLAVTSLRLDGGRVAASIYNGGARLRDARVRVTADGRPAGERTVTVGPHGSVDTVIESASVPIGAVGSVAATVDDPGGIPGDNTRFALADRAARAAALVVSTKGRLDDEAWYVRHALQDVRGMAAADLDRWSAGDLARFGAVILVSTQGLERRGREMLAAYVNAGGGLLIAAGPDVDPKVAGDVLGAGVPLTITPVAPNTESLAPVDVRHPIFRAFGDIAPLGLVTFRQSVRVTTAPCRPIARFTSGDAAILDCAAGAGRAIIVASDLDNRWNDFPTHASFVPFMDQAIRYLSIGGHEGAEYLVDEVPPGVPPVPGVVTMKTPAGPRRAVVNVDPGESEGGRMTAADFEASIAHATAASAEGARLDAAQRESREHVWQYLIAAALIALVAEGIVASRTA